jgi:thiamine pyrophosphokinase
MNMAIIANGKIEKHARLRSIWANADARIAADGGAVNARQHLELAPHVLIGDLDSLDEATRRWCEQAQTEFLQHPRAKDQTDLELAIDLAIARGAKNISILGTLGGRFDQMLANVLLLIKPARANIPARIAGSDFDAWIATHSATITGNIGDTVSLIPLSERVEGIVTVNLKYPLHNETLYLGSARGVSNALTTIHAEVSFGRGLLMIVHLLESTEHS